MYKYLTIFCWLNGLVLFVLCPDKIDVRHMSFLVSNTFLGAGSFFLYQKALIGKKFYLSISTLFTASMIVTHFQIPLAHVLGFQVETMVFLNFIWANTSIANRSVAIASMALLSFFVGYITRIEGKNGRGKKWKVAVNYDRTAGALTLLAILIYPLFLVTSGSYRHGLYGTGDQQIISNYMSVLFNLFLMSALILKMYKIVNQTKKISNLKEYLSVIGLPLTCIVLWHILFSIYVGDRGPILRYSLLYSGLYLLRISQKTILISLAAVVLIPVFLSVLGASRSRTSDQSFVEKVFSSDYKSIYSSHFDSRMQGLATLELSLSIRCLNHSVANVPANYDHKYGVYQLRQVLAAIPFLVGLSEKLFLNTPREERSSVDFISYLIQGKNTTYGDATTPVADLYLDFGPLGVIVGFLLFGRFLKKADLTIYGATNVGLFNWIVIMCFWSGSIYLGRATFLYYFQTVVQIYVVILLTNLAINGEGRSSKARKTIR